ncbi:arginase family protein [Schleiferiaceae bacterium]|nr:arginase family protein [Schleiferiaceae bacterium]
MSTVLEFYSSKDLLHRTSLREGETKLGQILPTISEADYNGAEPLKYRFVIVGIEEDYGVRANFGRGGADKAFQAFLQHFCNLQDNRFFPSHSTAILGAVIPTQSIDDDNVEALREATRAADATVQAVVERIRNGGAIPIIIGGGHNNSYGCLKGAAQVHGSNVNCLNIDAHSDLRALEGRHSGNGFSYAKEEGALGAYFMWGLQENYTPEYIWQYMENHDEVEYLSYEDYLTGEETMEAALIRVESLLGDRYAIELDVDVIAQFPSSARSSSGFTLEYVRSLLYRLDTEPLYFHLCEGRITNPMDHAHAGRALALLTADFIKAFIFEE